MARLFKLNLQRPIIVFLPEGMSAVVVSVLIANGFHVAEVWSVPELFDAVRSGRCAAVVTLDTSLALVFAIGSIKAIDANAYFVVANAKSTFDAIGFLKRINVLVDAGGRSNAPARVDIKKSASGRISDRPVDRLWRALKSMVLSCSLR